jgi:N-acetylglutamate synthase-like GNAT family acetyltransferase
MTSEPITQTCAGPVRVRRATPAEVVDLRHAVLRGGLPRETAIFPGDEKPEAIHVVAEAGDGRIVGCVTLHPSTWNGRPAWQLRGMATDPAMRGSGVGRAMLDLVERLVRSESGVRQMWCNARVPAAGFYQQAGWAIESEQFEIPAAGPHVRMTKRLDGSGL